MAQWHHMWTPSSTDTTGYEMSDGDSKEAFHEVPLLKV